MSSPEYDESREFLRDLATFADDAIVEVGVHRGKSLKYLAEGNGYVPIIGVDTWGLPGIYPNSAEGGEVYRGWFEHMLTAHQRLKPFRNVSLFRAYSFEVGHRWTQPVDLLFIDGDHSYEGVASDWLAWARHCRRFVVFDDYTEEFPQVMRFVDERWRPEVIANRLAVVNLAGESGAEGNWGQPARQD